jgi:hypothetical protein
MVTLFVQIPSAFWKCYPPAELLDENDGGVTGELLDGGTGELIGEMLEGSGEPLDGGGELVGEALDGVGELIGELLADEYPELLPLELPHDAQSSNAAWTQNVSGGRLTSPTR